MRHPGWFRKLAGIASTSTGSQFRRNFVKVARANVFALALPIAATPIMTRLFMPGDYGVLALFTSTLGLLVAFSTWRFDWVLPNAKTGTMAASLYAAGGLVLLGFCIAVALALLAVRLSGFESVLFRQLEGVIFLLPIMLAGAGLRQMFSGWFVRQGDLSAVSRATIAQSSANTLVGIGAGIAHLGAFGLVAAAVASTWAGIGALFRQAGWDLMANLRRVTPGSLRAAVRRHGRSASWSVLVAVVNALSLSTPILLLAYFYPPREIGWYALMQRLVGAPLGVLVSALGQSFWSQAAEYARVRQIEQLSRLYRKTTLRLLPVCIPVVIFCAAGPFLMGPILGRAEWEGAGYVLTALMPYFIGSLLFSPTNHLVVFDMQHMQLLVDSTRLLLVVASIGAAGYMNYGFLTAVALASLSSCIGHFLLFVAHQRVYKNHA